MLYLIKKNEINRILMKHYNKKIYRKLKFNTYINIQRSEDIMVNDFKKIMGKPENTIVVIGDYSDTGLRGTESSITKKTRKIFKRHGFDVVLFNLQA
jgi:ACT domain-containing protein